MSFNAKAIERAAARDKDVKAEPAVVDLSLDIQVSRLAYEKQALRDRLSDAGQKLTENKDLHDLRKSYTKRIFRVTCVWLTSVLVAIGLSGFKIFGFHLPDAVIIAFISSTTVTVVGLFIIVAKWLFSDKNGSNGTT